MSCCFRIAFLALCFNEEQQPPFLLNFTYPTWIQTQRVSFSGSPQGSLRPTDPRLFPLLGVESTPGTPLPLPNPRPKLLKPLTQSEARARGGAAAAEGAPGGPGPAAGAQGGGAGRSAAERGLEPRVEGRGSCGGAGGGGLTYLRPCPSWIKSPQPTNPHNIFSSIHNRTSTQDLIHKFCKYFFQIFKI